MICGKCCANQSDLAPGILDPGAGTRTAFLSSVKDTHWSNRMFSRSVDSSDLSTTTQQTKLIKTKPSLDIEFKFFTHRPLQYVMYFCKKYIKLGSYKLSVWVRKVISKNYFPHKFLNLNRLTVQFADGLELFLQVTLSPCQGICPPISQSKTDTCVG